MKCKYAYVCNCETCGNYFTSNHLLYNSESETADVCPYCGEPW